MLPTPASTTAATRSHPTRDHPRAARNAGLRYVSDDKPGIRRVRRGRGFAYVLPSGRVVRDKATLTRIQSLVLPPAWTDVWICPHASGHLQATGRDDRGRKQFRYHPRWHEVRDQAKFERMLDFARALPRIRQTVQRDLRRRGLPRRKVLAAVVALLEQTLIRVGNEEYAQSNNHFGLTTLRDGHARVRRGRVRFEFAGKSGVNHEIDLHDPRLATIVRRCQDLPGEDLFQYVDDDGQVVDVTSTDVNDYLREIGGEAFTSKDFRTWAGTVLAACALGALEPFASKAEAKKNVVAAVDTVARRLGNTRSVCRKCYIHPRIIEAYLNGDALPPPADSNGQSPSRLRLRADETAVVMLLRKSMKRW